MRNLGHLIAALFFISCASISSLAQDADFTLTPGRVGEAYEQNIGRVLADKYGMRLESGSKAAAFEWALAETLPSGLKLNSDGTITGVPQAHQAQPYRFKVKVTDKSMRDAEALELNISVQMMAPRIRLVKNTAPRLVPIDRAAEQAHSSATSTPVAPAEGVAGDANGTAPAQSQTVGPRAEGATRFMPTLPAQSESAALTNSEPNVEPQINPTPSPTPGRNPLPEYVTKFIEISETDREGKRQVIRPAGSLSDLSFADRKSIIKISLTGIGATPPPTGTRFTVSAVLPGKNPVQLSGGIHVAGTASGNPIRAQVEENFPVSINLSEVQAEAGDELTLTVERIAANGTSEGGRDFVVRLGKYGFDRGSSPSLFLLSRPGVSNSDIPLALQAGETMPNPESTDITNPVSYAPSPGFNYIFSYRPKPDEVGIRPKFLSLMEPGFGFNVTLMDFNDQTLSTENLLANPEDLTRRLIDKDSDIQLGVGGVASFFGNSIHLTYGANLNVEKQRGYFAFGIDVLKLINLVRPQ
jgi:hypothetical protein